MTPEIPKDVLQRARGGDRTAFRSLVESLLRTTFNLAFRMTYNGTDAEDLTQEIFLRLFQNLQRYDPALPFLPWYRKMATNCAINWKQRIANRHGTPLDPEFAPGVEDAAPSEDERLREAVRQLPTEYQACVTLHYLEGLGVNEIGETLNVPSGTVKTWLFRAREILKDKLKSYVERTI